MKKPSVKLFIQARMSSKRFPGKVLAPINGKPMIKNVYDNCMKVGSLIDDIIITTSKNSEDTPLVLYCKNQGMKIYKGNLENVTLRILNAAKKHNANYIVRVSGDSPFINYKVIRYVLQNIDFSKDIVTNIYPRSFPKGQSVEIIKKKSLQNIVDKKKFHKV